MSTEYRERKDGAELTSCDESSVKPLGTQLGGELRDLVSSAIGHKRTNLEMSPLHLSCSPSTESPAAGWQMVVRPSTGATTQDPRDPVRTAVCFGDRHLGDRIWKMASATL